MTMEHTSTPLPTAPAAAGAPRSGLLAAAVAGLVVAVSATLVAQVPGLVALALVVVLAWCAVPGWVLARRLYAGHPGAAGAACLLAGAWGFALSSLVLLALWATGFRHAVILLAAPLVAAVVAYVAATPLAGRFEPPRLTRRDALAACLVLLLVPLVVARPYAKVGADVHDGRAYRAYFTADFVWKMAVVAELSKGDMPPRNQFLRDKPLHYYWTPHLLSAVEYRALSRHVRLDKLLLANGVLLGLAFLAFLYAFARQFVARASAAALGCTGAVLFNSFEGLERLLFVWREGLPLAVLRGINIDAVTRWFYGALPVDGLQRLLLYQPQHHAMAYAVGLSAVLVLAQARQPVRPGVMLLVGTLLGASVLLSAFSALMVTSMAALYVVVLIAAGRQWRALPVCAAAGALPVALAGIAAILLEYVDRSAGSGGVFEVIVNPMAFRRPWLSTTLSFGPMLVFGLLGLALGLRQRPLSFAAPAVVVGVSVFFYCFVNVPDVQYVYVGWRSGHFLFIVGAALAGYALQRIWAARPAVRVVGTAGAVALALAAAPTAVIDLYNTQDIDNRGRGPGFNWTTVLTHDELEALAWIKAMTPPDAVVQVEPHVRHSSTWAYVPAWAERRLSAGLPLSMVPLRPYQESSARVRAAYAAGSANEAYDRAAALHIDYLIVGLPERQAYPDLEARLDTRPDLWRRVFANGTMTIYRVAPRF